METIRAAYSKTREALQGLYVKEEAAAIADLLFERRYGLGRRERLLRAGEVFTESDLLSADVSRLLQHEPVQHIIAYEEFLGICVKVGPEVLIPRPETEELLHWVFEQENNPALLADICCGSGCIALALRKKYPSAEIYGTDIAADSLALAKESEAAHFGSEKIHWIQQDILTGVPAFPEPEIIVCNPPYIMASEMELMDAHVLRFEPHRALFVYADDPLLFYKRVIALFAGKARSMYFELNPLSAEDLKIYAESQGLQCELRYDLSSKVRFARISA